MHMKINQLSPFQRKHFPQTMPQLHLVFETTDSTRAKVIRHKSVPFPPAICKFSVKQRLAEGTDVPCSWVVPNAAAWTTDHGTGSKHARHAHSASRTAQRQLMARWLYKNPAESEQRNYRSVRTTCPGKRTLVEKGLYLWPAAVGVVLDTHPLPPASDPVGGLWRPHRKPCFPSLCSSVVEKRGFRPMSEKKPVSKSEHNLRSNF